MNSSTDTSQMHAQPKRALSLFSFLLSLIAIALVIITAIFMFPHLAKLKETQNNTNTQMTSLNQSFKQSQATINSLTDQLNKQQADLKKLTGDNLSSQHPEAIYINQAISLLQLAQVQLSMQATPTNAIIYLKKTTELLSKTGGAHFASTISQLQSLINQLDKDSTLNLNQSIQGIDALKDAIAQLSLTPSLPSNTASPSKTNSPEGFYNKFKHQLSQLVIVRHHETAQAPLTTANDETSFKQNLLLKATEAEWSLLNNNAELYESSLSTIIQQLNSTPTNDQQKQTILKQVNQLKMQSFDLDKSAVISQIDTIMTHLLSTLAPANHAPTTPSKPLEHTPTSTIKQPQKKQQPHASSSTTTNNPISIEI